MSTFLLKHPVDISLLTNGFHIQTAFHKLVYSLPGGILQHGESREIKVLIDGESSLPNYITLDLTKQNIQVIRIYCR